MIILVDFDGTIIPRIPEGYCSVDTGAERVLKKLVESGHLIVLWTCRNNSKNNPYNYIDENMIIPREESSLDEAIRWFEEREIPLYGINSFPGEKSIVGPSRKIIGDILIDDTSLGIPISWGNITYFSYKNKELVNDYYTYCVDWKSVEALLIQKKII